MTMHKFIYSALPSRVIFGPGSIAQLAQEIDALGAKRALVLCTPEQKPLAEKIDFVINTDKVASEIQPITDQILRHTAT